MAAVPNSNQGKSWKPFLVRPCRSSVKIGLSSWLMGVMAVLVVIQSSGCMSGPYNNRGALLDNAFISYRDRVWAARAYNEQFGGRPSLFTDHHRRGFIEGYCNVCRGGDGNAPGLPPKDYWTSQYQSQQGSVCVNEWFEGFPEGAAVAKSDNAGRYSNVYMSQMLDAAISQQKEGVKLPSDIRVVRNDVAGDPVSGFGESATVGEVKGPLALPTRDWSLATPGTKTPKAAEIAPPPPKTR